MNMVMTIKRENNISMVVLTLLNRESMVNRFLIFSIYLLISLAYSVGVFPVVFLNATLK